MDKKDKVKKDKVNPRYAGALFGFVLIVLLIWVSVRAIEKTDQYFEMREVDLKLNERLGRCLELNDETLAVTEQCLYYWNETLTELGGCRANKTI